MKDRLIRAAILALTVAFAAAPFLSKGFGGFYKESFPVQVDRWPAQPVGWAFAIWGPIYAARFVTALRALLLRPEVTPGWRRAALPLGVSLFLGTFWVETAMRAPLLATALIVPMAALAIVAACRAGTDLREAGALGFYAGWLTAAAGVAVSVVLTGYGVLGAGAAAVLLVLAVLAVALGVIEKARPVWTYPAGTIWALIGIVVANGQAGDAPMTGLAGVGIGAVLIAALRKRT